MEKQVNRPKKKRQHIGVSRFDTWKCSYDIPIYLDDKHQF